MWEVVKQVLSSCYFGIFSSVFIQHIFLRLLSTVFTDREKATFVALVRVGPAFDAEALDAMMEEADAGMVDRKEHEPASDVSEECDDHPYELGRLTACGSSQSEDDVPASPRRTPFEGRATALFPQTPKKKRSIKICVCF